ncbi:helix-turn-helix domain-containing protein [Mariniflexile gromovii]|uniref:Helix-turn-helix transcriptional regulator n=1 Tax=Mariniflexile gromovii TaxID=362523 RepID=A0ABS4BUL2_9FLAO|nr:AraC family transcriptional regulator [Mariniflexile gromovii]MBP0904279.1 helix-turn-helix transcriptional regulator [Mariniflexile gromovii]
MEKSDIVYSCYHEVSRKGENFVSQHVLSFQMSGQFTLSDSKEKYIVKEGALTLIRKNQLVKFTKYPPENGNFESLNIYLNKEVLQNMAREYHFSFKNSEVSEPLIFIEVNSVLQHYIASLQTILENPKLLNKDFIELKIKELLFILIETQPKLKNILFDFSEPFKIDLESFMIQNYKYNVNLERFAYLTGRSLSTFKRDFAKIFHTSPHKWVLQKRLNEAHYLINEQKQSPSEIYIDLGFEDLSHFSYTFKKQFGYSPKKMF